MMTSKTHLVNEAYESLLRRAERYDEKDWDTSQRFERHAINAALDLRDVREINREMLAALEAIFEIVKPGTLNDGSAHAIAFYAIRKAKGE